MFENAKYLTENEKKSLAEIKQRVSALFTVKQYILFGSKARGDAAPDSDIDVLVITKQELVHGERNRMSDVFFEVNLVYHTNYSFVCVNAGEWESELWQHVPLHINVVAEGIPV
jgi:predicted nucleotidyltransferase